MQGFPTGLRFLPDDLNRAAFEAKSLSLFWDLYLPKFQSSPRKSRCLSLCYRNLTEVVPDLDMNDAVLRPALLALCLARIGESSKDPSLTQEGMRMYGRALHQMQIALRNPRRIQSDELIAACKLLSIHEVCWKRCYYLS